MNLEAPEHTRSIDNTTPTEGLGFVDQIVGAADDIRNGDIVSLAESAKGIYDEIGSFVADPVGYIGSMVVEWIMQHVEPLKGWINQLTGDSGQVYGMSSSWDSISSSLASIASELDSGSSSAMSSMQGEAVRAYLERQAIVVSAINAISDASSAFGAALSKVADSVVGAISDIIVTCFEVVAEVVLSLGTAAPVAAEQVASRVAKWVGRIEPIMETLTYALEALQAIFAVLTSAGSDLTRGVEKIGEQCQAPGGGCCGDGGMQRRNPELPGDGNWNTDGPFSNGATSGGTNNVGGDNNGINAGGDVNIDNSQHDDHHVEVNPQIEPHIEVGGGDKESSHKGGDHDSGHDGHDNGKGTGHGSKHDGDHGTHNGGNHGGNQSGNHGKHSANQGGNHSGNQSGNHGKHSANQGGNHSGNQGGNHGGGSSHHRSHRRHH